MPKGLEPRLAFHFLNKLLLRLVGSHPRDAFQRPTMFRIHSSTSSLLSHQFFFPLRQLQISLLSLTITLVYRTDPFLEGPIPLDDALFCVGDLGHLGLAHLPELRFRRQH